MSCPFCDIQRDGDPTPELANEFAFALEDRFPVTPGHTLLIPRRHVASYFDASGEEKRALWDLVERARAHLDAAHAPAGYNIGVNVGAAAGQTVDHLHVHLIPRYAGDMEEPDGGVRGVIPEKRIY